MYINKNSLKIHRCNIKKVELFDIILYEMTIVTKINV